MAPFTISTLPGEPIVWMTFSSDFKPPHIAESSAAIIQAAEQIGAPVYVVADIRKLDFTLPEMVSASNIAARGSQAILHHGCVKAFMLAAESSLFRTAMNGLNSEAFGFVHNIMMYATPAEALEAARAAIAGAADTDFGAVLTT